MGKILSTIAFCVLALCAGRGECEIRKSGASFGNNSFVITLTAGPDGFFFVFPYAAAQAGFSLKSFDPQTLEASKVSSFYLSLNDRGLFNAITLTTGERVSLGGDVFLKLNENSFALIRRVPIPLLLIYSEDSVIAFLGKTLVLNERSPQLVQAIKDSLAKRGEEPYSFNSKGKLVFDETGVGSRIGIELSSAEQGCDAPDATFIFKGKEEEKALQLANSPISLTEGLVFDVETGTTYRTESDGSKCLLSPIEK